MKFTLANFGTKNVTAVQRFPLFWKVVGILEDKCKLNVMAVTSQQTAQCTKCIRIWDTQPLQIMIKRTLYILIRLKTDC